MLDCKSFIGAHKKGINKFEDAWVSNKCLWKIY